MSTEQFAALAAQGFNRVPVARVVLADLDTPLSVYLKLADSPFSYLFESVQGGERWGRYSMIGLPARTVLTVRGHSVVVTTDGREVEHHEQVADPLAFVEQFQQRYRVAQLPHLPRRIRTRPPIGTSSPALAGVRAGRPRGCGGTPDADLESPLPPRRPGGRP